MDIYFKEDLIQRCKKIKRPTESLKAFMVRAIDKYVTQVERGQKGNNDRGRKE